MVVHSILSLIMVGIIIGSLVVVMVARFILSPTIGMVMGIPIMDILTDIPIIMGTIMDMVMGVLTTIDMTMCTLIGVLTIMGILIRTHSIMDLGHPFIAHSVLAHSFLTHSSSARFLASTSGL